jgi:hydroxymethylpyrimidine pyrophosphatase-like HAD family hydrolase
VKLSSIALDYDGTIARADRIEPDVREAIALARSRGVTVLLATGRILDDLRRVAGELHFVDGVVAENGAVLHFPESDHTSLLAPLIPQAFLDELIRRGVSFHAGKSLVDADASSAPAILDVIHALELPLVLIFNKGRVMAMPQGVSKGTGLQKALDTLRLSARNTLAIGDAENDHELLRLAEVGVAVPWGSAALRAAADIVVPGDSTATVAGYVRTLADTGSLPAGAEGRRKLLLGHTEDGQEFSLATQGRNVLVAGDTRSGKSWIAGLLCEQLILHGYCLCVIDPEGDYRALEALPGVTLLGGEDPPPSPRDVMRALRYPDRSIVIDLSRAPQDEKLTYIRNTLSALNHLRRRTGLPHRIVIDEAHYFLHDGRIEGLIDLERDGYTVVTYCASKLPKALLDSTEVIIVTCESNPAEIDALFALCGESAGGSREEWNSLSRLRPGQAMALPITAESGGRLRLFNVARRLTPHVRHREKYVDVPVSDPRAFVFAPASRARTLRQFVAELERRPAQSLEPFVVRSDFSKWIKDVFGDHSLAAELRAIESRHRGEGTPHTISDLIDAIRSRYDLREEAVAS